MNDDHLSEILELAWATGSRPLRPSTVKWLGDSFRAWLSGDGDLPAALGISNFYRARLIRELRDDHLRKVADMIGGPSPTRTAEILEVYIREFRENLWPTWQLDPCPPSNSAPIDRHLFYAFKYDKNCPGSSKQMILKTAVEHIPTNKNQHKLDKKN